MRYFVLLLLAAGAAGLFAPAAQAGGATDLSCCAGGTATAALICASCDAQGGGMLRDAAHVTRECARVCIQAVRTGVRATAGFLNNFRRHVLNGARALRRTAERTCLLMRRIMDLVTTEVDSPSLNRSRNASSSSSGPASDRLPF